MSEELIQTYRTGGGGGVALLAELNGYPGPRHILDLADDLELTSEQLEQIQALIDVIQPEAIQIGEAILAGEAALEEAFRQQTIDERSLEARLTNLGTLQAELRFIHLRTHLATVEILTPDQIERYNIVRGYAAENSSQGQHGNHRITQNAD
jgi:Spy/CpxP family protein refolding chaperone